MHVRGRTERVCLASDKCLIVKRALSRPPADGDLGRYRPEGSGIEVIDDMHEFIQAWFLSFCWIDSIEGISSIVS